MTNRICTPNLSDAAGSFNINQWLDAEAKFWPGKGWLDVSTGRLGGQLTPGFAISHSDHIMLSFCKFVNLLILLIKPVGVSRWLIINKIKKNKYTTYLLFKQSISENHFRFQTLNVWCYKSITAYHFQEQYTCCEKNTSFIYRWNERLQTSQALSLCRNFYKIYLLNSLSKKILISGFGRESN